MSDPLLIAERYEPLRALGEGTLSQVLLVRDTHGGALLALKRLQVKGAATTELMRNEYAALARIEQENVVRVHEFGTLADGETYFTMDYVDGCPIDEAIAPGDVDGVLAASLELLRGLEALHAAGVVHGDIKPANVLVNRGDGALLVRLVDLGFVGRLNDAPPGKVRGTPGFAAPELLAGAPYTRESDLFALGATLYKTLAGRPAFPGRDAASILAAVRQGQVGVLPLRAAGITPALDGPLLAMLSPDPANRRGGMRAWRELAEQRAGRGAAAPTRRVHAGPLVGRDALLAEMCVSLLETEGTQALVLVGPEGSGRTRMAREVAIAAELSGRPVTWLDGAITGPHEEAEAESTRRLLVLDDVDRWSDAALAAALKNSLGGTPLGILATQARPPESGDAIYRLLLGLERPPSPEVRVLAPLRADEAENLVSTALGHAAPAGLTARLAHAVGSYPGALLEELDRWIRRGQLESEDAGWRINEAKAAETRDSAEDSAAQALWRSLDRAAQRAAVARAGWPTAITIDSLAARVGLDAGELRAGIDELFWRGLVGAATATGAIVPASLEAFALDRARSAEVDPLRRSISGVLLAEASQSLGASAVELRIAAAHQQLALGEVDEARATLVRAFEDALQDGGDRALAMRTGDLLVERTMLDGSEGAAILARLARLESDQDRGPRAEILWQRALDALPPDDREKRFDWALERSFNLQSTGQYERALALVEEQIGDAGFQSADPLRRGRAISLHGWCLHRLNRWPEAHADFAEALTLIPASAHEDRSNVLNRFGFAQARQGNFEQASAMLEQALEAARASGDRRAEARVRGNRAAMWHAMGDPVAAQRETRAAMRLMEQAGSLQGQMVGASNLVSTASARTDWEAWDEGHRLLDAAARSSGNPLAYARACELMLTRCVRRGAMREAAETYERGLQWLVGSGNEEYERRFRDVGALLRSMRSEPTSAREELQTAIEHGRSLGSRYSIATASCALAELELAEHRTREAEAAARLTWADSAGDPTDLVAAAVLIARALAREGDAPALEAFALEARPRLDEAVRGDVRDAAPALAELEAYRAHFRGDRETADARWTDAIAVLRELELLPRRCGGEWTYGLVCLQKSDVPSAIPHLRTAYQLAASAEMERWAARIAADCLAAYEGVPLVPPRPVSRSGHATELLPSIIRLVNSMLDFPALLDRALALVSDQVHADRGFILLTNGAGDDLEVMARHGQVDDATRSHALDVSRTIVRWVMGRDEVFRTSTSGSDPRLGSTQSMLDLSIRSLVCVPMRQRGEVIGTIYLESRRAGGEFSETDVALVESFADLVGVAIESSRLHDELRRSRDRILDENLALRRDASRRFSAPNILGQSIEMERVLSDVARVATTGVHVLITGETGTGKELIAKTIHYASPRANRTMLSINCGALAEGVLEAELFGVEKGAATGVSARPGIFERADGGTLFLDEIGDMPLNLQAKVLRVIQEQEFTRVGGSRVIKVDLRFIAATWRNLEQRIAEREFRQDLLFRLQQMTIHIPPLRDRRVDIPILVEHFLGEFCEKNARAVPRVSEAFLQIVMDEPWPGNVRELENYVVRNAILCDGPLLEPVVPRPSVERARQRRRSSEVSGAEEVVEERQGPDLDASLRAVERRWIEQALQSAQGNQRKAAESLGLVESTLRYRMRTLGIGDPKRPKGGRRQALPLRR